MRILVCGICITALLSPSSTASRERFERGDAIYRYGAFGFGHAGLYIDWQPEESPDDRTSHTIIDAITEGVDSVVIRNFKDFCSGGHFWSVRKWRHTISATQRRKITNEAIGICQNGARYNFFFGYKKPLGKDPTFRCDGLVEYCYEVALGHPWWPGLNGGIVINDTWLTMAPVTQMVLLNSEREAKLDTVRFISPCYGDSVSKTVPVTIYMHDGVCGSGVAKAQLWVDGDTTQMQEEPAPGDTWSTAHFRWDSRGVKNGSHTLYTRGFDQAGNDAVDWVVVLVSNYVPVVTETYPEEHQTGIPPDTTLWIEFNKRMDTTSVENSLLFIPDAVVRTSWDDSSRLLLLEPELDLEHCSQYTLTISDSARDYQGRRLDGDGDGEPGGEFRLSFRTGPPRLKIWAVPPISHVNQGESVRHQLFVNNLSTDSISGTLCALANEFGWEMDPNELWSSFTLEPGSMHSESILVTNIHAVGPIDIEFGVRLPRCDAFAELYSWVAGDHIWDHPDETYDISDRAYAHPWLLDTESKVGLLLVGWGDGLGHMLGEYNIHTTIVKPDFTILNDKTRSIDDLAVLLIGSAGLTGLSSSPSFKDRLDEFVYRGGTLVVLSQQNGEDFECLPGVGLKGKGWNQDQSCFRRAAYVAQWHPILAGQERAMIDCCVDGYFSNWPENSDLILRRTSTTMPCLLTYGHGHGTVLVTSMFGDWGLGHSQTSWAEKILMRDIVTWGMAPRSDIPIFNPNQHIELSAALRNTTEKPAAGVTFYILSPYRDTLEVLTANLSPPLECGEQRSVSVNLQAQTGLGIYPVSSFLTDEQGEPLEKASFSHRFLVRKNIDYGRYEPGDLSVWSTTETEFVTKGSEVKYDIHIRNMTSSPVDGKLMVGVHENKGRWWAVVDSLIGLNIAADSTTNLQFIDSLELSTSTYFGLYLEDSRDPQELFTDALSRCEKGIWVGQPSCELILDTDRDTASAEETLTVKAILRNRLPVRYRADVTLRLLDPDMLPVSVESSSVEVDPIHGAADSIQVAFPTMPIPGIYTIEGSCFHDSQVLSRSRVYITIPESDLTALVHIPVAIGHTEPIEICLLNTGSMTDSGGTVCANLETPDRDTVWTDLVSFDSIAPGESTSVVLCPRIRRVHFGTHRLNLGVFHQGTPVVSVFDLESSLVASMSVDPTKPVAGESVTLRLQTENTGSFLIDATVGATVGNWYSASEEIQVVPESPRATFFQVPLPADLPSGQHPISISVSSGDTLGIESYLYLGDPSLALSCDRPEARASDTVQIFILNDGRTSCSPAIHGVLYDPCNTDVSSLQLSACIKPGQVCTLLCTIPHATCTGEYMLEVSAVDSLTAVSELWQRQLSIDGVSCSVNAEAGSAAYSSQDTIDIHCTLNNESVGFSSTTKSFIANSYPEVAYFVQQASDSENTIVGCQFQEEALEISPHSVWLETCFTFSNGPSMPSYIALDRNGFIYTTDFFHNRVYKMDPSGGIVLEWGRTGCGAGEFGGIWGIAVDDSGYVYVSDFSNLRIQKFTGSGEFVFEWSIPGCPWDLCIDDSGFVYVVDFSNAKIRKYSSTGEAITKWGSYGPEQGQFREPWGIGTDGSQIYVADTYNHRIQVFTANGEFLREWGRYGHDQGDLTYPSDVAVDPQGFIYTGELGSFVSKFTKLGKFVTRFTPQGQYPPTWSVAFSDEATLFSGGYQYLLNRYSIGTRASVTTRADSLVRASRALAFIPSHQLNDGTISYSYDLGSGWQPIRRLRLENLEDKTISFKASIERPSPSSQSPEILATSMLYLTADPDSLLWKDSTNVFLAPDTALTFDRAAVINSEGRLFLCSELTNDLHQKVSSSLHRFFMLEGSLLLSLVTDKPSYMPHEDISIIVGVGNCSPDPLDGVCLDVRAADQIILTDTLDLAPSHWDTLLIITSADSSLTISAVASTSQGDSVHVSENVTVVSPSIVADISAPRFASHEPFQAKFHLMNTSPHLLDLDIHGLLSDSIVFAIEKSLPPYGEHSLSRTLRIVESENVNMVVQGDLDTCISKLVQLSEDAVLIPRSKGWYESGYQMISFDILNRGMFDLEYTILASAIDSSERILATDTVLGFIPKKGFREATVGYHLSAGTYRVDYALVCPLGDTLCQGNTAIQVREPYDATIDSLVVFTHDRPPCGVVDAACYVRNTGTRSFKGDLSLTSPLFQTSIPVDLQPDEPRTCSLELISAAPEGRYELTSVLTRLGVDHDSCTVPLDLEAVYEVALTETLVCRIGELVSCFLDVTNSGDASGLPWLKFDFPAVLEDSHSVCLDPCSTVTDSFDFLIPPDFETGCYNAVFSIDTLKRHVAVLVSGLELKVEPEFDKQHYALSDTALLNLHVENTVHVPLNLEVKVISGECQRNDSLSIAARDTTTMQFSIPVEQAGKRVFYGFYLSNGRALYLDAVYLVRSRDTAFVYTENQVYKSGDTATAIVEALVPGLIFSEIFSKQTPSGSLQASPPGTTFSFTIPDEIVTGTYSIDYTFIANQKPELVISNRHLFDVIGYTLRILQSTLDRGAYTIGDTLKATHVVTSNRELSGFIQAWIRDSQGFYATCYKEYVDLGAGVNRLVCDGPVCATRDGPATLMYGIFKPKPGNEYGLLLAAGMKALDLEPTDSIPPEFVWFAVEPDTFNPLRNETTTMRFMLSESCSVCEVRIADGSDNVIARWSLRRLRQREQSIAWKAVGIDAGAYSVYSWATDFSHNVSDTIYADLFVAADTLPPSTSLHIGQPRFSSDPTYVSSATWLSLRARDDITGVAKTEYCIAPEESDEPAIWHTYTDPFNMIGRDRPLSLAYGSTDRAGNREQPKVSHLLLDNTPPEIAFSFDGPMYCVNEKYISPRTEILIYIEDPGSGCKTARYSIDTSGYTSFEDSARLSISEDGRHSIAADAADNLGNQSHNHLHISVDGTPPDCALEVGKPSHPLSDGFIVTSTTPIILEAFDAIIEEVASGVASIEYVILGRNPIEVPDSTASFYLTGEDGEYIVVYSARDHLDNVSPKDTTRLVLDNTPPVCEIHLPYDSTLVNRTISIIGTVNDAHFRSFQVEYAVGLNPVEWTKDGPPLRRTANYSLLKHFNTGLIQSQSPFYLRVIASDLVENTSCDSVLLHAGELTVVDTLFLPKPTGVDAGPNEVYVANRNGLLRATLGLIHSEFVYKDYNLVDVARLSDRSLALLSSTWLMRANPPRPPGKFIDGLTSARRVELDPSSDFYVAQNTQDLQGGCVVRFNSAGEQTLRIDGLANPSDVTVDEHYSIYITERDKHLVRKFDQLGEPLMHFGGFGSAPGKINRPGGIAVEQNGYIWVSDTGNGRIQGFDPLGNRFYDFTLPSSNSRGQAAPQDLDISWRHSIYVVDESSQWVLHLVRPFFDVPSLLAVPDEGLTTPKLAVRDLLNLPNPFNPDTERTVLRFVLSREAQVYLYIYDMAGRIVKKSEMWCLQGLNHSAWDGRNSSGHFVPNGVYYLKLHVEGGNEIVTSYSKIVVQR